jgi:curved DNA-binding protein CbpA
VAAKQLPDYYADLGVKPVAGQAEIERIYSKRVAALRASQIEDVAEELAQVEKAYAVLHNAGRRAEYDRQVTRAEAARYMRTRPDAGWFEAFMDRLADIADIFD